MTIPNDLSGLLQQMATDLPTILQGNLVGLYLWGSLTYDAFDEICSDVDCIGVTRRDLDGREFSSLGEWFANKKAENRWVDRIDMRFVISGELSTRRRNAVVSTTTREGSSGMDRTATRSSG